MRDDTFWWLRLDNKSQLREHLVLGHYPLIFVIVFDDRIGRYVALFLFPPHFFVSIASSWVIAFFKKNLSYIDTIWLIIVDFKGFPGSSDGKASACKAGDLGSIPGLGRSPGDGNGNSLQYSCLENSMDRGAWWGTIHGITKSQTQLSD